MDIMRQHWRQQPPTAAPQINRGDPLTRNITTLIPFGHANRDLITGRPVTLAAGHAITASIRGRSLRGSGSAACASMSLDLSAYNLISISFWMYWDAFANDDDLAMEFTSNYNSNNGFLIDPNSGAPAAGFFQCGTGGTSIGSSAYFARPSAAAWHHYALILEKGSALSGGLIAAWVDGASQSLTISGTGGTTTNFPNSTLYFFSRNNASLFGAGQMQNLVIRGGYSITPAEVRDEYQRPWALYAPRRILVPVSSGATSYTITGTVGNAVANGVTAALNRSITSTVGNATADGQTATVLSTTSIPAETGNAVAAGSTATVRNEAPFTGLFYGNLGPSTTAQRPRKQLKKALQQATAEIYEESRAKLPPLLFTELKQARAILASSSIIQTEAQIATVELAIRHAHEEAARRAVQRRQRRRQQQYRLLMED